MIRQNLCICVSVVRADVKSLGTHIWLLKPVSLILIRLLYPKTKGSVQGLSMFILLVTGNHLWASTDQSILLEDWVQLTSWTIGLLWFSSFRLCQVLKNMVLVRQWQVLYEDKETSNHKLTLTTEHSGCQKTGRCSKSPLSFPGSCHPLQSSRISSAYWEWW